MKNKGQDDKPEELKSATGWVAKQKLTEPKTLGIGMSLSVFPVLLPVPAVS